MKYLPLDTAPLAHTGYQQQVKEANIKRIFDLVRSGKCNSRAEIVRAMQLSATSVSVLVEELASRGLIDETGPRQTSQPGRRPISLRLNSDAHQLVIFSLHRRYVRYTLLDLECRVLECRSYDIEAAAEDDYMRLFEDILAQSRRFIPGRALMAGITFPGLLIQTDQSFHTESTLGISLSEAALRRFQQRVSLPVYLFNSTRSLAYAEKKCLDAARPDSPETRHMIFVQIRDGISGAIIACGNLFAGPCDAAGEIGHFTIDYHGRPCPCGNVGCLERYVNLNAILDDARNACAVAGIAPPASFDELAARYPSEPPMLESVRRSARLLSFGLYSILCSSGIRRIVLGGGIEKLGSPFLQQVYREICSRSMLIHSLDLSYPQAGPDAESIGIAQHFLDKVFTITT